MNGETAAKKVCELCGGTGQSSYFKGESRFLLSHEDCIACCGTGFIEATDLDQDNTEDTAGGGAGEVS